MPSLSPGFGLTSTWRRAAIISARGRKAGDEVSIFAWQLCAFMSAIQAETPNSGKLLVCLRNSDVRDGGPACPLMVPLLEKRTQADGRKRAAGGQAENRPISHDPWPSLTVVPGRFTWWFNGSVTECRACKCLKGERPVVGRQTVRRRSPHLCLLVGEVRIEDGLDPVILRADPAETAGRTINRIVAPGVDPDNSPTFVGLDPQRPAAVT